MRKLRSFIFPAAIIAGIAGFALLSKQPATGADYSYDSAPELVVATFSSAWCSSCKILEPRLSQVIPSFKDQPVKFVELDFTFGQRDEVKEKAQAEGLGDIYPQFEGATGFSLLVDRETGEVIDSLTIKHSKAAMRAAIAQALAVASRDDGGENEE